jgi:hypothetical protein
MIPEADALFHGLRLGEQRDLLDHFVEIIHGVTGAAREGRNLAQDLGVDFYGNAVGSSGYNVGAVNINP